MKRKEIILVDKIILSFLSLFFVRVLDKKRVIILLRKQCTNDNILIESLNDLISKSRNFNKHKLRKTL